MLLLAPREPNPNMHTLILRTSSTPTYPRTGKALSSADPFSSVILPGPATPRPIMTLPPRHHHHPAAATVFVLPSPLPLSSFARVSLLPRTGPAPLRPLALVPPFQPIAPSSATSLWATATALPGLGTTPLATAGASLLVSSTLGLLLEKRTKPGKALGASLIAFLLQAVLSNLSLIPMDSPAYDACWSKVLPASLSLSVLLAVAAASTGSSSKASNKGALYGLPGLKPAWIERPLFKVSVANAIGALGALGAGVLCFYLGTQYQAQFTKLALAKIVASICTTHIGGSINFFQVARAVGLDKEGQGLLGAVAGADIFLMALYFAVLLGIQRNPAATSAFLATTDSSASLRRRGRYSDPPPAVLHFSASSSSSSSSSSATRRRSLSSLLPPVVAMALAFAVGEGGQLIETRVGIPGIAAGTITALSIGVFGLVRRVTPRFFVRVAQPAGQLSGLLFSLFFAAIGAGASLGHLVQSGPVIVALMSLSLFVHLSTTLVGVRLYNRFVPPRARISVDEALIASNANVGGPATAAAMAGSIQRPDLVLPAAATGTTGYALATFLGVALFNSLTK